MSVQGDRQAPRLVVLTPAPQRGQVMDLAGGTVLVGRDPSSDLVLDDPHVSRTHAVIRTLGDQTVVEDLGSSGGTTVNGVPAVGPWELRNGDVITFATVTAARFEAYRADLEETRVAAALPPDMSATRAGAGSKPVHYEIAQQHAGTISNVGRDQFNTYVQQRESFLRDVAATKSKARVLAWLGLAFEVIGFVTYGGVIIRFIERIPTFGAQTQPQDIQLLGPDLAGVPVGVIALALSAIGSVLLVVGIVLHVVAAARRRRIDRDMPLPLPSTSR
jgi:FHA domain